MSIIGARTIIEDQKRMSQSRLLNWFMWKILLPLGILALLWPIYSFFRPHPFESAFAHGDLILFAVLILLEAAVEAESYKTQGKLAFQAGLTLAKVGAILLLLIFGCMKIYVMMNEGSLGTEKTCAAIYRMHLYSSFNWFVALVAVIASILAYWTAINNEHEARLKELSE
jgi:hypothetical protein